MSIIVLVSTCSKFILVHAACVLNESQQSERIHNKNKMCFALAIQGKIDQKCMFCIPMIFLYFRPEISKEMAIEALELLGASFANDNSQYDIGKC